MEGLDHLPTWVQVAVNGGVFLGVALVTVFGYTRRKKPAGEDPGEGVVVSATIADGHAVRNLTSAVRGLNDTIHNLQETLRNNQDCTRLAAGASDRLAEAVREATDMMERKAGGAAR